MILKIASIGDDVKALQSALRSRGFYSGAVDGIFGLATEAAVLACQAAHNLKADGVVGPDTWNAVLDPSSSVVAPSTRKIFPPLIEQWRPWFERADAAIAHGNPFPDPFPIDLALKWCALESGGNACATGKIVGDHVVEAGLAQTYFETPTTRVLGITSAELRALCPCEGTSQNGGVLTDHARQIHAQVAIGDMHSHRDRARARLAKAGVAVNEQTKDFACFVKLVHALPGPVQLRGASSRGSNRTRDTRPGRVIRGGGALHCDPASHGG